KKQKVKGKRQPSFSSFCLLPFAFCLLQSGIEENDVYLAGAVDARHQAQLDVAGLARPGDQGPTRRPLLLLEGKQVEQVWQQLAALGDRQMDGRQQAERAWLIRTARDSEAAGFGEEVIDAGDAHLGRESVFAAGGGSEDLD